MTTENWIQILIALIGVAGLLSIRILNRVEKLISEHEKTLSNHETRITVIEKTVTL